MDKNNLEIYITISCIDDYTITVNRGESVPYNSYDYTGNKIEQRPWSRGNFYTPVNVDVINGLFSGFHAVNC